MAAVAVEAAEAAEGAAPRLVAGVDGSMAMPWAEEVGFLANFGKSGALGSSSGVYPWQPLRCATSLKAPYQALVDFLAKGHNYDNPSLAVAVRTANGLFDQRRLPESMEMCAIAYEIARLHFDYRPLLFNLVVQRVLCMSMLGDIDQALGEAALAEQIVPCTAVSQLVHGILSAKLGKLDNAYHHLQKASQIEEDSTDFLEALVAFISLRNGDCSQAITITSKILERKPRDPFALLVRCDAYKFHPSGCHGQFAEDDFKALMGVDVSLRHLAGHDYNVAAPRLLDEVVLQFHPYLKTQGPRPYEEYPMYHLYLKRRHFMVACWLVYFIAKCRVCARSRRVSTRIVESTQELLEQRAHAEQKLWQLLGSYKTLSSVESSKTEVWGPADPDSSVRKYRRYWMEKPLSFPLRKDGSGVTPAQAGLQEDYVESSPRSPGKPESLRPEELPGTNRVSWALEQARLLKEPQETSSDQPGGTDSRQLPLPDGDASPQHKRLEERITSHPAPGPGSQRSLGIGGAVAETKRLFGIGVTGGPPQALSPEPSSPKTQSSPTHGASSSTRPAGAASERPPMPVNTSLLEEDFPSIAPSVALEAARRSRERTFAQEPPYERLGGDWTDAQWLNQGLQFVHAAGCDGSLFRRAQPPEPLPDVIISSAALVALSADREAPRREADVISVLSKGDFDMIPEWYFPLDKVFEITNMVDRRACEEPLQPPGMTRPGDSRSSYVVKKPKGGLTPRSSGVRLASIPPTPPKADAQSQPPAEEASPARVLPGGTLPPGASSPPPAQVEASRASLVSPTIHSGASRSALQPGPWEPPNPSTAIPLSAKAQLHEWHRQNVNARRQESARILAEQAEERKSSQKAKRSASRKQPKQKAGGSNLSQRLIDRERTEAPMRVGSPPPPRNCGGPRPRPRPASAHPTPEPLARTS